MNVVDVNYPLISAIRIARTCNVQFRQIHSPSFAYGNTLLEPLLLEEKEELRPRKLRREEA